MGKTIRKQSSFTMDFKFIDSKKSTNKKSMVKKVQADSNKLVKQYQIW